MRKYLLTCLIIMYSAVYASKPLKIGVVTDTHFLSTTLMDGKYAIQNEVDKSGRNAIAMPEILDIVLADYEKNAIDVLLICGDLTKDGEKESHLELRDRLKPLYDRGTKIFVIPGNHDINMPNSKGFLGNQTYRAENISPTDFATIYQNYGYKNAINRDNASLSYLSELSNDTWLLAIDAARYEEYNNSAITAGRIKPETKEWMKNMLEFARNENKRVIAMMHWGIAEHIPMQASLFKSYLVEDYQQVANLLADHGVRLVFTGHFHSNDISKHESEVGNSVYDIETGTLCSYPFSYRFLELHNDSVIISTKNITSIESDPNLIANNKETMKRIASTLVLPMLKKFNLNFSEQHRNRLAQMAGELFLLHLAGDEVMSEELKKEFVAIFKEMDFPIDESMNELEIDLPPKDNNVTIYFK